MSKPKTDTESVVPEELWMELLTPSEVRMIKNRWRIIQLIREGLPVRQISEMARVGTDTVVRMSKKMQRSSRLRRYFGNTAVPDFSSRWVFGREKEL